MRKQDTDTSELEDQLAEAQAQIESLQLAAADAEARAATARAELSALRESQEAGGADVAALEAERNTAQGELAQAQTELAELRSQLREAATRYRAARLAGAPEVPEDLVPAHETIEEIDREFESAKKVVSQLREKMAEESREVSRARIPAGSPARRAPDLSSLSASEKIKLGLQQLSEREGR